MDDVIVAAVSANELVGQALWPASVGWPVPVVLWPEQADRSEELAREGRIRLFLVAPGAAPPVDWDGRSDWIRRPAAVGDIYARIEALQRRADHANSSDRAELDDSGILRVGDAWEALPPIEARLMRLFLDRAGVVVSRGELVSAGWLGGTSRALDPSLQRLRTRIARLGLRIVNVRRRGYVLAPADA